MKHFWNDLIGQLWTLLGMFVAWIVLDGSAKTIVGWLIIICCVVWMATNKMRDE